MLLCLELYHTELYNIPTRRYTFITVSALAEGRHLKASIFYQSSSATQEKVRNFSHILTELRFAQIWERGCEPALSCWYLCWALNRQQTSKEIKSMFLESYIIN